MAKPENDRRTNRSDNQRDSLTNLLDYTRMKGGFQQALIVDDEGELVASSTPMGDAATLAPMASVLQKTAGTLSGPISFRQAETVVIQATQGNSMACHFFEGKFDGAVIATIDGKMPSSAEKILASTAESCLRIIQERKKKNG